MSGERPVVLLRGADAVVLRDAALRLVADLVGDADHGVLVEEVAVGADAAGRPDALVALVEAAQTPPLLSDFRVVVGRVNHKPGGREELAPLLGYLADPLPTTRLVLEWGAGAPPKALVDAVASCGGEVVDTSPARKLSDWVSEQLALHGLRADPAARDMLAGWLGDAPAKLVGLAELARSTFGPGARVSAADLAPFLGEGGGALPWELTDAIDAGDIPRSIELARRMLEGGGRHPFQVLAILHAHFSRILRLDGAEVAGEREAAALLGLKGSTYPARKALRAARRLGHDRVVAAIELLAQADLDLRGAKAWPDGLVLEILVARLARLSRGR